MITVCCRAQRKDGQSGRILFEITSCGRYHLTEHTQNSSNYRYFIRFLVVSFPHINCRTANVTDNSANVTRIIGGAKANLGDFPGMVSESNQLLHSDRLNHSTGFHSMALGATLLWRHAYQFHCCFNSSTLYGGKKFKIGGGTRIAIFPKELCK